MNRRFSFPLFVTALIGWCVSAGARAEDRSDRWAAIDEAAIRIEALGAEAGHGLVLGNGNLGAIINAADGQIIVTLLMNELAGTGGSPCPRECGRVIIELPGGGGGGTSAARLDLRRAVAIVDGVAGKFPAAELRVTANGDALHVFTAGEVRIEPAPAPGLPPAESGEGQHGPWFRQAVPSEGGAPALSYAVALARFDPRKKEAITSVVGVVTSIRSGDVAADASGVAGARFLAKKDRLIEYHERAWGKFWSEAGTPGGFAGIQPGGIVRLYFGRCLGIPAVEQPPCEIYKVLAHTP